MQAMQGNDPVNVEVKDEEEVQAQDESAPPYLPPLMEFLPVQEEFKLLTKALNQADVAEELRRAQPFTFFAPTDTAFAQLPPLFIEMLFDPDHKHELKKLLLYKSV